MRAYESVESHDHDWERPWRLMRVALIYLLDVIEVARDEVDGGLDPLVISLVSTACVAPVTQDPRLQRAYATLDRPPPDDLRRPITINAIAGSLGLPFETVRRTVHRLAERNLVEITPRGVVQSEAAVLDESYVRLAGARYDRTRRLYADLQALGVALPGPDDPEPLAGPPVRIVNRLIGEYTLRMVERLMRWTGEPLRGLMLLEIARASADHLDLQAFSGPEPISDAQRRAVRISEVARRLKLPNETVRRHLQALEADGLLKRRPQGYFISAAKLGGDDAREATVGALQDFRRFAEKLGQLGVLAWWDDEARRV